MRTLPTGLLLSAALLTMVLPVATGAETTPADAGTVQFGMDANSVAAQTAAGVAPDYGTFWIGPWTLSSGWAGPDGQLTSMKNAGVTPAIHFYYWGDDISPSCVENGCWSSLHNAQKDRAGWERLGTQLTDHLNAKMGGEPVVIFLESEFNKGGISTYEPFDGYMAEMARKIHAGYPNAIVVLGFGAWDSGNWYRFDQVAAESDMVGVQAMRGSTRDSATHYNNVYEGTLASVQKLDSLFGKPVMLTDLALSSHPEPSYLTMQADNLAEIFANLDTLKANGLEAMIYRSWRDSPKMDLANYYGEAERHWGLAYPDNTQKAAGQVWVDGVKAERAGSTTSSTTTATVPADPAGYTASVAPSPSSNEWWVQVGVSPAPAKVEVKVGDGAYVALNKESYGWAKSVHAVKGTLVQFRVTDGSGATATTPAQAWLVDMAAKTATGGSSSTTTTTAATTTTTATTTTAAPTTTTSPPTTTTTTPPPTTTTTTTTAPAAATVKVDPSGNEWWVQAGVSSTKTVTKVEAKVGDGGFVALNKESYGWAKSIHAPKGTLVQFRVTESGGQTATTTAQAWLVDMTAKTASFAQAAPAAPPATTTSTTTTAPATTAPATVTVTPSGNVWWVQAGVSSTKTVTKVEAKVGSDAYVALNKESYGWAKSIHATKGTLVQFRVTASDGQVATTAPQAWLVDMSAKTASFGTASSMTTTTAATTTTTAATTATTGSTSGPFRAKFSPQVQDNNYWVQAGVTANHPIVKVQAKVNGGSYVTLDEISPGIYAKGMSAPDGAKVTFRATSVTGATYTSIAYTWG